MTSRKPAPQKETVFLHGLPRHVEDGLIERAAQHERDPAEEAADIIERHVEESGDDLI